jgi:XTP/dITP diphosphohydrolase
VNGVQIFAISSIYGLQLVGLLRDDASRMTTLLIATRNAHKVGEIRAILGDSFHYLTLNDFPGAPAVIEDADTFAGNAAKKALELAHHVSGLTNSKLFILADDSGLEVDALNGAPGVHSARYAALDKKGNATDAANRAKLLKELKNIPETKRIARFRCVLALVEFNPQSAIGNPQFFDRSCEGKIISSEQGSNGFGYDSLFVPEGFNQTFGELPEDVKNRLSHRAKALAKLKAAFQP